VSKEIMKTRQPPRTARAALSTSHVSGHSVHITQTKPLATVHLIMNSPHGTACRFFRDRDGSQIALSA
jgi:hypothetical protein